MNILLILTFILHCSRYLRRYSKYHFEIAQSKLSGFSKTELRCCENFKFHSNAMVRQSIQSAYSSRAILQG